MVRIQPNHIDFNFIEGLEDIHGTKTKARKGLLYTAILRPAKFPSNILNITYFSLNISQE
jgi:hypothetical protein